MEKQPVFETEYNDMVWMIGTATLAVGTILVVSSFWQLGWFGTWHGELL